MRLRNLYLLFTLGIFGSLSFNVAAAPPAGDDHASAPPSLSPEMVRSLCEGEVAQAFPPHVHGPGLRKRRDDFLAACEARRSAPPGEFVGTPEFDQAECDAEVARAYPPHVWGPGLRKKREDMQAACLAQRAMQRGDND